MNRACPHQNSNELRCKYCVYPNEKEIIHPQGYVSRLQKIKKQLVHKLLTVENHLLQSKKGGE